MIFFRLHTRQSHVGKKQSLDWKKKNERLLPHQLRKGEQRNVPFVFKKTFTPTITSSHFSLRIQ